MEQTKRLTELLSKIKEKEGKSFVTLSGLFGTPTKGDQQLFGLPPKKLTGPQIEKAIRPYLGDTLTLLKGSKSYVAFNMPLNDLVCDALRIKMQKGPFSPGQVGQHLPMVKATFVQSLNTLIAAERITVSVGDDYKVKITSVRSETQASDGEKQERSGAKTTPTSLHSLFDTGQVSDKQAFCDAFDDLDRGGNVIFVRICNMRRKLGWERERFDEILRKLRTDRVIQLHAGDSATLTQEDVTLSFTDENNMFYATVTMKPKGQR